MIYHDTYRMIATLSNQVYGLLRKCESEEVVICAVSREIDSYLVVLCTFYSLGVRSALCQKLKRLHLVRGVLWFYAHFIQ